MKKLKQLHKTKLSFIIPFYISTLVIYTLVLYFSLLTFAQLEVSIFLKILVCLTIFIGFTKIVYENICDLLKEYKKKY